ncbi:unnamed protein product [Brugia timori]|uniref:Uncharacterized protein n=1 Tax=Brugia timori TaxID=42155 RepID=A0A3P7YHL1_9BILA|nr:unnamed protein product [Brugia timori]
MITDFSQRLNIGPANGQSTSNTQATGSSPGLQELQW